MSVHKKTADEDNDSLMSFPSPESDSVSIKSDTSMMEPIEFNDATVTPDPRLRTMIETLNELAHLRNARFGRPWPRHGLKLLYWFANECISFENGNIKSECDPANRDFGFHYFENRYDDYGAKLLPDIDFPYYVVGNLNSPGAEELPDYVSEDKSPDLHNSNTDRIIVSLDDEEQFHRVYLTQHHDRSNYDPNATYRISRGLLMIIRRRCLKDFLEEMGYYKSIQPFLPTSVINYNPQTKNTVRPDFTVGTPSSSDSPHKPPATQSKNTHSIIQMPTPDAYPSENVPTKGFWESFCTIL